MLSIDPPTQLYEYRHLVRIHCVIKHHSCLVCYHSNGKSGPWTPILWWFTMISDLSYSCIPPRRDKFLNSMLNKIHFTKIGWLSWSLAVIKASIIDLLGLNRILCLNRHLSKKCSKSKQRVHEVLCYYWENYIQPSLGIWTNDLLFNARRSRNCGIPLMTGC